MKELITLNLLGGHGGTRIGAGRPKVAECTVTKCVTLDVEDDTFVTRLGQGNFSAGIRIIANARKGE